VRRQERFRRILETLGQPARGFLIRAVPLKHRDSPLCAIGSLQNGGRYNPKGEFEILYFARDADTALREVGLVKTDAGGRTITVPTAPFIVLGVEYEVSFAVDFTDCVVLSALGLTSADLTGGSQQRQHNPRSNADHEQHHDRAARRL